MVSLPVGGDIAPENTTPANFGLDNGDDVKSNCGCDCERNFRGRALVGGGGALRNIKCVGLRGRLGGKGGGGGDVDDRQFTEVSLLRRESKNGVLL